MSRDCHAYATCHCEYNAAIPWRILAMTICCCLSLRGVIATKQSKWGAAGERRLPHSKLSAMTARQRGVALCTEGDRGANCHTLHAVALLPCAKGDKLSLPLTRKVDFCRAKRRKERMKKIACGNSLVDILSLSLLHRQLPHQREPNHRYARRRVPLLTMTLYPPVIASPYGARQSLYDKNPRQPKGWRGKTCFKFICC